MALTAVVDCASYKHLSSLHISENRLQVLKSEAERESKKKRDTIFPTLEDSNKTANHFFL